MISTATTRWICSTIEADRAAVIAAQAVVDEEGRRLVAQQSYTTDERLQLLAAAEAEQDWPYVDQIAWEISRSDSRYVMVVGWGPSKAMKRPADVPDEVCCITVCTCDGGECCYCTCCELWNGEHSCEWGRSH